MLNRRVSVRDVAAAAAVSPTTASMVLNGRDANFPEPTRQRVWDAARSLGYRPNRLARNLVCQSSELIGAVIEYVENPFFSSLAAYLNRRVAEYKYRAMFQLTELNSSREDRDQAVDTLLSWRVAGILHWWNESYGRGGLRAVAKRPWSISVRRPRAASPTAQFWTTTAVPRWPSSI